MKNKLSIVTYTFNITVISLAVVAWTQQADYRPRLIAFSTLLALCAFVLMWVHYISDWCRKKWFPEQTVGWQYNASRWFVLIAILSHPFILNGYLAKNNYGLPPGSYQNYYGKTALPFIILGTIGLLAFLSFEFKKRLKDTKIWQAIIHFNNLAMLLIVIHGFKLGIVTESTWYFWVWSLQAIILCLVLFSNYLDQKVSYLKYAGLTFTLFCLLTTGWFIFKRTTDPQNSGTRSTNITFPVSNSNKDKNQSLMRTISASELSENNGLNGAECWIAINDTVYNASNNSYWNNGQHVPSKSQAKCGKDLTNVISRSPHGTDALNDIPKVGNLR